LPVSRSSKRAVRKGTLFQKAGSTSAGSSGPTKQSWNFGAKNRGEFRPSKSNESQGKLRSPRRDFCKSPALRMFEFHSRRGGRKPVCVQIAPSALVCFLLASSRLRSSVAPLGISAVHILARVLWLSWCRFSVQGKCEMPGASIAKFTPAVFRPRPAATGSRHRALSGKERARLGKRDNRALNGAALGG